MTDPSYLAELFSLDQRVALVTGGSSGIGRAMAEALGRAGASVVVLARRERELSDTVRELRSHGCRAAWVSADLGSRTAVREAAEEAVRHFGEPDILVNCAAINLRPPLGELSEQKWDQTMAVNLDAPFLFGQRFGPVMAERGWGRIINVASQQSFRAFGNSGAYGVSKAGVVALSRSQAEAWSPHGVTSNAIVPGFVITALTAAVAADPAGIAALSDRTMLRRNGVPQDFRGAAVFLASRAADYVTGQAVFVDGGFSAR